MAKRRFSNIFVIILSFIMLAGCATRIGTQANIDEVVFTVGKTTKKGVADILGLPALVETDKKTGAELWGYQKSATLESVEVALVYGSAPSFGVLPWNFYSSDEKLKEFQKADMVYRFNKDGVLIDAKCNRCKQQGK